MELNNGAKLRGEYSSVKWHFSADDETTVKLAGPLLPLFRAKPEERVGERRSLLSIAPVSAE